MLFIIAVALCVSSALAEEYEDLEHNPSPCMISTNPNAYNQFLKKHVNNQAPTTLDQNLWQKFIRDNNLCNRPVQSFLPYSQKADVERVCSSAGGKIHKDNLCVSLKEFNLITVKVDNNCILKSVINEKKYIILACDQIANKCLPVHFESNPTNTGPDPNSGTCQKPVPPINLQFALKTPAVGLAVLVLLAAAFTCYKCLWKSKKKGTEHTD